MLRFNELRFYQLIDCTKFGNFLISSQYQRTFVNDKIRTKVVAKTAFFVKICVKGRAQCGLGKENFNL